MYLNFGVELSLLRREYMLSAVNVFKKSLKTLHVIKSDFFSSINFTVIHEYGKGSVRDIDWVSRPLHHAACPGVLSNGPF